MGGHVDLRFFGQRWEREPPWVHIWLQTPLSTEASSHGLKSVEKLRQQAAATFGV